VLPIARMQVGRTTNGRSREYRGRAGKSRGAAKLDLMVFIAIANRKHCQAEFPDRIEVQPQQPSTREP